MEDERRRLNQNDNYYGEVNDRVFLKLFCDGSLEVGMFSDDECTNYISDKVDMYETTGLSFTADDIGSEYMTSECTSCVRKNMKYYHGDGDYQNNNNNNNNNNGDDEEEEEMLEICERVYEDSLKCNDHLSLAYYQNGDDDGNNDEWSETLNEQTCAFIEAVQQGEIDDQGYVSTSEYYNNNGNSYWSKTTENFTNEINNSRYMPRGFTMSQNQFTAVIILFFASMLYCIYAFLFKPKDKAGDMNVTLLTKSEGVSA